MFYASQNAADPHQKWPDLNVITFASATVSPICDIEPLLVHGYSRECYSRPHMKTANRRESPRIDIKLRCHITSPVLGLESAIYTENISRSGLLMGWRAADE